MNQCLLCIFEQIVLNISKNCIAHLYTYISKNYHVMQNFWFQRQQLGIIVLFVKYL